MPRVDLFTTIHKAVRAVIFDVARDLPPADVDHDSSAPALDRLERVLVLLEEHHEAAPAPVGSSTTDGRREAARGPASGAGRAPLTGHRRAAYSPRETRHDDIHPLLRAGRRAPLGGHRGRAAPRAETRDLVAGLAARRDRPARRGHDVAARVLGVALRLPARATGGRGGQRRRLELRHPDLRGGPLRPVAPDRGGPDHPRARVELDDPRRRPPARPGDGRHDQPAGRRDPGGGLRPLLPGDARRRPGAAARRPGGVLGPSVGGHRHLHRRGGHDRAGRRLDRRARFAQSPASWV